MCQALPYDAKDIAINYTGKTPCSPEAYILPKGIQYMVTYIRHKAW